MSADNLAPKQTEDGEKLPVFALHDDEWTPASEPVGHAFTRAQAARILRRELGAPELGPDDVDLLRPDGQRFAFFAGA